LIRRFGSVLAEYQRTSHDKVLVSWIGGEPLLWEPLKDLTVFFTEQLGLQVSTTTNGTTLRSSAMRKHLLAHYAELTVSVDGIGEVHDSLRGWAGGYQELRDSVTRLAEGKRSQGRGPLLRANVVLMRQTVADFEPLCCELANWGIEEITFNQLGGRDRPEFFPDHRLLPEQAESLANEISGLRSRLAGRNMRLNGGDGYLNRILASSRDESLSVLDCHPGEQFLFINESGIAAPCNFTSHGYGIPVSELPNAEALRELPKRFAAARRARRLPPCEDCHSTRIFEKFAA
jgi:MoaA/NifB/PqqE/SkfB family radical SAM enzyme